MNLDFTHNASFSWYVVLLLLSGVIMLVMAILPRTGQRTGWRIVNLLISLGFLGYGSYLAFIFTGGTYFVFFKVFFVPLLLVVNFVRTLARRKSSPPARRAAPAGPAPEYQQAQYPQPQYQQGQYPQPQYQQGQYPQAQYPPAPMQQHPPAQMPQYPGREGTFAPRRPPQG